GPNDEVANDTQDIGHHLYMLTLDNRLHLAPLCEPKEILDVGTGTGIWAIDMADLYPRAQITGTDLSPIQPEEVPPNCQFEIDDATLEWTWNDDHFDFVHIRELFGCIPDWTAFLKQAYRCIKPGGWVEIVEHSTWPVTEPPLPQTHFFNIWGYTIDQLGEAWGKTFRIWSQSKDILEGLGFVDVVEKRYRWPLNPWSKDKRMKEIGFWNRQRTLEGMEGFMLRLLTNTGNAIEKAQVFLAEMRMALKDKSTQAWLDV
ncbi:hypothetical protein LTR66_000644, partial [Elasticomyces elasticus]